VALGRGLAMITTDQLIKEGILEEIPQSYRADQFCLILCNKILGGAPDLGTTLLGLDTRGRWAHLGGFLDLNDVGDALHGTSLTKLPGLMTAIRESYSEESLSEEPWTSLEMARPGFAHIFGLTKSDFGVIILGATVPLEMSDGAKKLLTLVTDRWLSRHRTVGASGPPTGQQDSYVNEGFFTGRQIHILRLLAESRTNTEIAKALSISASLAKQEVAFLSHALQARNRLEIVMQAQKREILTSSNKLAG
jgi:DNA-binding CsgD family transcriptional regulator